MRAPIFDVGAGRRPTNLSVDADLLRQARELGIKLSQVLERALVERIRDARAATWLAENAEAIAAYNREVERRGAFSDGLRRF